MIPEVLHVFLKQVILRFKLLRCESLNITLTLTGVPILTCQTSEIFRPLCSTNSIDLNPDVFIE
jgi:hypothetical protein